jgi:DsbC/DsbD-like thiol-disulfide interchange protein
VNPLVAFITMLLLAPAAGGGEEHVSVEAKLSQDGVLGGTSFEAALVVTVGRGWHVNSTSPSDENLIATLAAFSPPPGLDVARVHYPRGTPKRFSFSDEPLDVYEGTVVIRLSIAAAPGMKPGEYDVPVDLSYQACNNDICLAPATARVVVSVHVLPPDAAPVRINPGLFGDSGK